MAAKPKNGNGKSTVSQQKAAKKAAETVEGTELPEIEGPKKPDTQYFEFIRHTDESGISGTGVVAEGVVFSTGKTVVQWLGSRACIHMWDSFEQFQDIHLNSHSNQHELVWYDRRKRPSKK